MGRYLELLKRNFILYLISYLIVGIPGYVLTFTVLPQYIRFIEPKPLTHSLLLGFLWALMFSFLTPVVIEWGGRLRAKKRGRVLDP
uniref:Uncharacterized protein n=1 Tax=Ignisphaera aggregans TaxID=334771 RepID=A0A7C4FED7_9CREN